MSGLPGGRVADVQSKAIAAGEQGFHEPGANQFAVFSGHENRMVALRTTADVNLRTSAR
jgi:hypothetical protein